MWRALPVVLVACTASPTTEDGARLEPCPQSMVLGQPYEVAGIAITMSTYKEGQNCPTHEYYAVAKFSGSSGLYIEDFEIDGRVVGTFNIASGLQTEARALLESVYCTVPQPTFTHGSCDQAGPFREDLPPGKQ